MSTQYNAIQGPYDFIRKKSIAHIERENVQTTIAPFIRNARVLELACGSGHYTYDFLRWGASSVVGVDVSPVMIEENRRRGSAFASSPDLSSRSVHFILADCSKPISYAGGPFDLVFGAWLLNYAPNHAGLVGMYRNIALNLKDGGRFVSVTVPPAQDPKASANAELSARPGPEGSGGLTYQIIRDVEDGMYFNCHAETEVGDLDFECYHLRKDVYEAAAREAGFKGELKWGLTSVPERYLKGEGPGGASFEELKSYQTVPNYGSLVIVK